MIESSQEWKNARAFPEESPSSCNSDSGMLSGREATPKRRVLTNAGAVSPAAAGGGVVEESEPFVAVVFVADELAGVDSLPEQRFLPANSEIPKCLTPVPVVSDAEPGML